MMQWRPCALRSAGVEHTRYREANVAAINAVDLHALHSTIERLALSLIDKFCRTGRAEIIGDYAFPIAFEAINTLVGCPPDIGVRVADGLRAMLDCVDSEQGNKMVSEALLTLIEMKRSSPGDDITTRLLHHPAGLDDSEMVHQLATLYGPGIEPQRNLITNTLLLMLTDDRFGGVVLGGSLSTRDALDELLFDDPPIANFSITYPRQPILVNGLWVPADEPVVIGIAAANTDPAIDNGYNIGNRSHLAWGAGPHSCPAQSIAYLVAHDAIEQLLDVLPDMRLTVPTDQLTWRPGPFHRALTALPVTFPPTTLPESA
ncbi:cytochrome P450 [Nocardia sp. CA-135953]|uniref:cytochrome P450 n=1 Tax=Nocardia sp. CA-135953 TaxID=3239978 RepID=UPI003D968020